MLWPAEWIGAGVGLASSAVGAIIALLLAGYDVQCPYLVFLFTVIAALTLDGINAGFCAAILSALFTWFFFFPPLWSFALPNPRDALAIALFLASTLLICWVWNRQRRLVEELTDSVSVLRSKLKKLGGAERY